MQIMVLYSKIDNNNNNNNTNNMWICLLIRYDWWQNRSFHISKFRQSLIFKQSIQPPFSLKRRVNLNKKWSARSKKNLPIIKFLNIHLHYFKVFPKFLTLYWRDKGLAVIRLFGSRAETRDGHWRISTTRLVNIYI